MVQGAIKLIISSDARQAEEDLKRLEEQKNKIAEVERENAELSKSHAQAAASAQKAAKSVDDAFSKLQAAKAKQENYVASIRERFDFGGNLTEQGFAGTEEALGMALSTDKEYQKMSGEVDRLTAELGRLKEAQATAEVSEAELGERVSETSRKLSEERARMSECQETYKKSAAAIGKTSTKLKEVSRSSQKAARGLFSVKKQSVPLTKSILKLSNMFKLMVLRMAMRKAIDSVREGIKNLAKYSTEFNGTMSKLKMSSLYLSNALATVFKPILEALTPIIEVITDKIVGMANIVASFTASLFGNATSYTKAEKAAADYGESVDGVAKSNENALASFDEINKISFGGNKEQENGLPKPEDMFQEEEISEKTITLTDKIKEMFAEWGKAAQPTIAKFKELMASLEPLKTFVATGLQNFYNTLLVPIGNWVLGEGLPRFLDITRGLVERINWAKLNGALKNLWAALQPLAQKAGEGLLWFYENVISPLVAWASNVLIPHALGLITAALEVLDPVIDALRPVATWLWENFLKPLGAWTGEVIINAIQWLTDRLNEFADWARENPEMIQAAFEIILGCLAGLLAYKTVDFVGGIISKLSSLAGSFDLVKAGSNLAAIGVGALIAAIMLIAQNWDDMSLEEKIQSVVGAFAIFAGVALSAAIAAGVFNSAISMGVAAALIVAGIALVTSAVASAQKRMQEANKGMSTTAPNTYSTASMPLTRNVPHFATGAVIPPNNEILAVMGDNKYEKEYATPESAMKQSFLDAIKESGLMSSSSRASGDIILEIDGRQFARITNPYLAKENKRVGARLVKGVV